MSNNSETLRHLFSLRYKRGQEYINNEQKLAQTIRELERENRQQAKQIAKLHERSKEYLEIYRLLVKHHPPTKEGLTSDR